MSTIKCIECGTFFDSSQNACPVCGCPSDAVVLCPECAMSYDATLEACPECGCPNEKLVASATSVAEEAQAPNQEPSQSDVIFFATEDEESVPSPTAVASDDAKLCRECGESLPPKVKICPNCGCPVEVGKVCCLECGEFYDEKLVECPVCGCPNETIDLSVKAALLQQEEQELAQLAEEKRRIANFLQYSMNYENEETSSVGSTVFSAFIRCANFKGRSRRSEFWCYLLFNCLIGFGLYLALFANFGKDYMKIFTKEGPAFYQALIDSCLRDHLVITLVIMLYVLILILPTISLVVRRLHDTNRSGLWLLIAPLTFILSMWVSIPTYLGLGVLTIMLLLDSVPDNKYGRCHIK